MPLPSPAKKPLLLLFPDAQVLNYERCLCVAKHLRPYFNIQFLHTDKHTPLVYQHGFDTFSNALFSPSLTGSANKAKEPDEPNLELQFLEQVEMLETLQPALIIGDGIPTLSMAAEFTGIPLISILNGYQSYYFANEQPAIVPTRAHVPYQILREKYGLLKKQCIQKELEGDLNWICDLPEFFPQRELPFHYTWIGPLFEIEKPPTTPAFSTLNPFKKIILIDIDNHEQEIDLSFLNAPCYQRYNLIAEATKSNQALTKQIRLLQLVHISEVLPQANLLLCNTERLIYKALLHDIPTLFKSQYPHQQHLINALEHWHIGASWKVVNTDECNNILEYWTNKHPDAHRTIKYKVRAEAAAIGTKLLHSLTLHFPFFEKAVLSYR